ncbi:MULTISPECIES: hypothetical protein [unclassified Sphingomonas]|uniref:hypothetical protein n=1 Tax=unclassified Sphingomonas TaxID=196159 RepID=UPI000BDB8222|nr:MAG: hypothetical protein B7Y98_13830 [Sphingomonas sp. 32-62-10]
MSALQVAKLWLIGATGLSKDALHVYVALILFFGSAVLFKWSLAGWRPWTVVLVAAVSGEAWDIRDRLAGRIAIDLPGDWHDIWNTMFWPSVILLVARTTSVFGRSGSDRLQQPLE